MSFDKIFDLTAGLYVYFYNIQRDHAQLIVAHCYLYRPSILPSTVALIDIIC